MGRVPASWKWLALGGLGAAALSLLLGIVLLIQTRSGTVKIELSDPKAQVEVKVDGDAIDIAGLKEPLRLKAGEHGLLVTSGDYQSVSKFFTVRRGQDEVLRVTLEPKAAEKLVLLEMPKPQPAESSAPSKETERSRLPGLKSGTGPSPAVAPLDHDTAKGPPTEGNATSDYVIADTLSVAGASEATKDHSRRAWYLLRTNDLDGAIAEATEAIRLDAKHAPAYAARANAYWMKGNRDRAILDLSKVVIRLHPDHEPSYAARASAYRLQDDYEKAILDATEAIRLNPKYAYAYYTRDRYLPAEGRLREGNSRCHGGDPAQPQVRRCL